MVTPEDICNVLEVGYFGDYKVVRMNMEIFDVIKDGKLVCDGDCWEVSGFINVNSQGD